MKRKVILNDSVKPYKNLQESKTSQLTVMFNTISKDYDSFNNLMSWGLAHIWRRKAMSWLKPYNPNSLLDCATGTADMIILAENMLQPATMTGIDISEDMMQIGREKILRKSLEKKVELKKMDCSQLSFDDQCFDALTIAFGIRNLEMLSQSIREMNRVLKKGGHLLIIEMNEPRHGILSFFYKLYIKLYVSMTVKLLAEDKDAYSYLMRSIHDFPQGKELVDILTANEFKLLRYKSFTLGVCSAYLVEKMN
jgi:demethylmenaquinone methyltransferase/2-methoxy-6-polyprenyl-1,4-benzoquinol methylase